MKAKGSAIAVLPLAVCIIAYKAGTTRDFVATSGIPRILLFADLSEADSRDSTGWILRWRTISNGLPNWSVAKVSILR
jgi:hypothetical protein